MLKWKKDENWIGNDGIQKIGDALKVNKSLQVLGLCILYKFL